MIPRDRQSPGFYGNQERAVWIDEHSAFHFETSQLWRQVSHKIQGLDVSGPSDQDEWNVTGGIPENDDEEWQNVPYVNRNTNSGKVKLNANWHSNDNSNYSVPPLGSSH